MRDVDIASKECGSMTDNIPLRARMVEHQLVARGIDDALVLDAFYSVPREDFVPEALAHQAYLDGPQSIGDGQTISQPYIVALTVQALALKGGERVLEIGTGSGYEAAILSRIAKDVFTVERIARLAETATDRLARLGYHNVHVLCGDGTLGWEAQAPFDGIAVSAGGPKIPEALLRQLTLGGRLVIPVGADHAPQRLIRATRTSENQWIEKILCNVLFVPLIGREGWASNEEAYERSRPVIDDGAEGSRRTHPHKHH